MSDAPVQVLGRYALHAEIAAGGMATIHLGRLLGPVGFSRTVAIKRLHAQFAKDPDFVAMFLDEARVASRIQHPNVISTLDVVALEGELFLVMEYVEGESLSRLLRAMRGKGTLLPPRIAGSILTGMLYGLHAAHEAKNEHGDPLGIIHRDVSPQNVLVGLDGVARVLDFGVAKAAGRVQTTKEGQVKGKLAYMPPEQILGDDVDRRVDVYAAGVVAWETLTCKRLFDGENEGNILKKILAGEVPPPSALAPELPPGVDAVVLRALSREREERYETAWELAVALEEALGLETPRRVGAFVDGCAKAAISRRSARVRQLESISTEADAGSSTFPRNAAPPRASDPSSVLSRTIVSPRKSSGRALLAVLAILTAGAAVALTIIVVKGIGGREPGQGEASTTSGQAPSPPPLRLSATSPRGTPGAITASATVAAPASASAPSSSTGATSASASSGVTAIPSTRPTSIGVRPTTATAVTPPPTADPCKPPTFYENGIKKIKPQCIK